MKTPLVVLGGNTHTVALQALHAVNTEAVMCSFEGPYRTVTKYLREHTDDWQPVRYLDSGVFSLMSKRGVTRTHYHDEAKEVPLDEIEAHCERYLQYVIEASDDWDFLAELDVDAVGAPLSMADHYREMLVDVVGPDKLMPVWHSTRGPEGWRAMVDRFHYLAIGTDEGKRDARWYREIRHKSQLAHQQDRLVHFMGMAEPAIWLRGEVDSADVSSWLGVARWGLFYTGKGTVRLGYGENMKDATTSEGKKQSLLDFARQYGVDEESIKRRERLAVLTVSAALYKERINYVRERLGTRTRCLRSEHPRHSVGAGASDQ